MSLIYFENSDHLSLNPCSRKISASKYLEDQLQYLEVSEFVVISNNKDKENLECSFEVLARSSLFKNNFFRIFSVCKLCHSLLSISYLF